VVSVFITTGRYVLSDLKALKIGAYSHIIINQQGRFWDGETWVKEPYQYYYRSHLPKIIEGYALEGSVYVKDGETLAIVIESENP